jgi:hypothetical protein
MLQSGQMQACMPKLQRHPDIMVKERLPLHTTNVKTHIVDEKVLYDML